MASNPQRMGPLRLDSRRWALAQVLDIQSRCRPVVDLINEEEELRIRQLIDSNTWPDGWDGTEAAADAVLKTKIYAEGVEQDDMLAMLGIYA